MKQKQKDFFKKCRGCYHYLPKDRKHPERCQIRNQESFYRKNMKIQKEPLYAIFYRLREEDEQCDKFIDGEEGRVRNKRW